MRSWECDASRSTVSVLGWVETPLVAASELEPMLRSVEPPDGVQRVTRVSSNAIESTWTLE